MKSTAIFESGAVERKRLPAAQHAEKSTLSTVALGRLVVYFCSVSNLQHRAISTCVTFYPARC